MPHQILIADDDPAILDSLAPYLRSLGYGVTTVDAGDKALDAAMEQAYDLAILDVRMPELSGSEIYTRLRNINPELEAIFFTADKEFESSMDFLRFSLPKERVLTKPVDDLSELTRLIVGILGPPVT